MVSGCTCGSKFKIGGGFDFVCQRYSWTSGGASYWCITAYCAELGAYYGTYSFNGKRANQTAAGGVISLTSASNNDGVGTSVDWGSGNITIASCNFAEVASTVSGKGSVTISGTAYNSKYRKVGDSITFTASPINGYKLKKMLINGSEVTTTNNAYTMTINQDVSCVCYFVPSSYTVTCNTPSGGTVAFTKNGTAATASFTAVVDDVIACTCTPNASKMVQNFVVDGNVTAGGSTGAQTFTFTIYEREDDATYNCTVSFCDRTAVSDTVVGKSDGSTDDATVTTGSTTVTRDSNGVFAAYVGNTYTATAHDPTNFRTFDGWINANGESVSTSNAYSWTQGSSAVGITAKYTDKGLYTEAFYIGTSTSDYGTTSGTAYVAGCRASIARPSGTTKDSKWLGGTRTVTADTVPSGWSFSGVYVSDTDASGGTCFYAANGASSVTFDNACNANIYAIFANGDTVSPSDVDQGNSSIASGSAAQGLYIWEGNTTNMTMRWHSKRFIASMPIALSVARVYADAYKTGTTNDVKLTISAFQSPSNTDTAATTVRETYAKSQDAYRLPMRRPEKYVEIEVSSPHQVTQMAVATGMEALWERQ